MAAADVLLPSSGPHTQVTPLRMLAYVHLRNIHNSTGAGRTARQIVEHLAVRQDVKLHLLVDSADRRRILPLVGAPWDHFAYHEFAADTSRQQARWLMLNTPSATDFWADTQLIFCTGESYVPPSRSKLAVTMHDAAYFEPGAHRRDLNFWKTNLKWRFMFHRLNRRADMIHTVSQFSAERLAHFFPGLASRIRVVHNGVTPHFFEPPTTEGLAELRAKGLDTRPFVLVPGGLHFRKNAELILAAAPALLKACPDLILAVVNHSDPAYLPQANALGERFRLLGFVSDELLRVLYGAARVVWFPSRYEGFGLPVVEAMACGAPVVASDAASIPEVAGDAALLMDGTSPTAHTDALIGLLEDDRSRTWLAHAGRARAQAFTWAASAQQLKQHFDSLV